MKKFLVNPFRHSSIVAGRSYIPPMQALMRVCSRLHNGESSFIVGLAKSGKSSLISNIPQYYSSQLLRRRKFRITFVSLDAQGNMSNWSIDEFWQTILMKISTDFSVDITSELELLRRHNFSGNLLAELFVKRFQLRPSGNKLVLLIDEFETLVINSALSLPSFWGSLRMLSKHGVVVIAASRRAGSELDQITVNIQAGSPFFNHYTDIHLTLLTEKEIEILLDNLLQKSPIVLGKEGATFVEKLSGGQPFLAQACAGALFDSVLENNNILDENVFRNATKLLLRSVYGYFIELWKQLLSEERLAIAIIALVQIYPDLLRSTFFATNSEMRFLNHSVFSRLCQHGLLTSSHTASLEYLGILRDGKRYNIKSYALLLWLGSNFEFARNKNEVIQNLFFAHDTLETRDICLWFAKIIRNIDLRDYSDYHNHFLEFSVVSSKKHSIPVRVFYSYHQNDRAFCDEMEKHLTLLQRKRLIEVWHYRQILSGENCQIITDKKLAEAELVLLLVSPSFLASDYLYSRELCTTLDRHARGQARVVPILVRPVDLSGSELAHLKPLPSDGRPVSLWSNLDEAWLDVAKGIREVVLSVREPDSS